MNEPIEKKETSEHRLIAERRLKLAKLRDAGAFPNDFRRDFMADDCSLSMGPTVQKCLKQILRRCVWRVE